MFGKKKRKPKISKPLDFEHMVHTDFDATNKLFVGESLPLQWSGIVDDDDSSRARYNNINNFDNRNNNLFSAPMKVADLKVNSLKSSSQQSQSSQHFMQLSSQQQQNQQRQHFLSNDLSKNRINVNLPITNKHIYNRSMNDVNERLNQNGSPYNEPAKQSHKHSNDHTSNNSHSSNFNHFVVNGHAPSNNNNNQHHPHYYTDDSYQTNNKSSSNNTTWSKSLPRKTSGIISVHQISSHPSNPSSHLFYNNSSIFFSVIIHLFYYQL
ncbi:hypothetical protein HELRODRAFT_163823 [Helobdella robusta]|uniref:CRIB domain-containing protein n=1 Tax=Helobdella robusta TaxID=6412 RepID=T1EUI5_HELRO|nr:hypothetical protein HELRODRAFT_163823 [Helobdella robusta]ESN96725.1 hypothetical protein HELRODRAFT_163823 [Helobdella robusta]